MRRISLSFLLLLLTLESVAAQTVPPPQPKSANRSSIARAAAPTPQEQSLAYWTAETGWSSEIHLRNNQNNGALTVTPVLRTSDGTEVNLAPVIVQPQEVKAIDLDSAIVAAGATQLLESWGSVVLRYSAPFYGSLYAAEMIHRNGHAIAIHIDGLGQDQVLQVGGREGIWWLPKDSTSGYLVLSNQGGNPLALTLSLYDAAGNPRTQSIQLGPRATNRYSIRQLLAAASLSGRAYGGIKVSATSYAGSLNTFHFLYDETANFSAILKMFDFDPNTTLESRDYAHTGVWTLRAPMLALSSPDAVLGFPAGTTLQPQILVRNTTGKVINATLKFNWRNDTTTGHAAGPALRLNPFETLRVDIAALQDGKTLPPDARWTSVTLTTDSNPEEVIAVAASYDATFAYGAQTPFSDQLTFKWEGDQWEVDPLHDSMITAGNGGTGPTRAAFTIFYNQGTARYDIEQTLQPDEQMWIDVGKLITGQVPDKNGNALPVGLTSGSYEVRDLTHKGAGTLYEGKVIYDKTYGHAAYGCALCCGYGRPLLPDNPFDINTGSSAGEEVDAPDECQNGLLTDVSDSFFGQWSSDNTSIATVDTYGNVTGVSAGSTIARTFGTLYNNDEYRNCPLQGYRPSGSVNVAPTLSTISPAKGPLGVTVTVTINGSGFGTSPTVNAGTGITVTVNSATNTQIQASFNISASATQGNQSVTVTAGGQTSSSVNFFLQVPTSLSIVAQDSTTPEAACMFTSGGVQYTGCGVTRSFLYQVYDQANNTIQAEMLFWDSFGTVSPNPLNIGQFATTCTPAGTGPCGITTDSNGQFMEQSLSVCSVVCRSNGACVAGGPSVVTQTWHVGTGAIAQSISYYCQKVLVNGA
jgi:hypothetical protein